MNLKRLKRKKLNIDPKNIKINPKTGSKPQGLVQMQISSYRCFPRIAVMDELSNAIRKRWLQEKLNPMYKTEQQRKLYTKIKEGKLDDEIDLYMDELTEMVKAKVKERKYWKM